VSNQVGANTSRKTSVQPASVAWMAPARKLRRSPAIIGAVTTICFLGAWQGAASTGLVSTEFLPSPSTIVNALVKYTSSTRFPGDLSTSAQEFAIGYGLSVIIAVPIGIMVGWYRRLRYAVDPLINLFYSMPRLALIPLVVIWFGVGITSRVVIVLMETTLGIIIPILRGVMSLNPDEIQMARSFNATALQSFRTIALPASFPHVLAGLRLGTSYALVGVVVGEFVDAQNGLGAAMLLAGNLDDIAELMAILVIFAVVGLILRMLLQMLENHYTAWRSMSGR